MDRRTTFALFGMLLAAACGGVNRADPGVDAGVGDGDGDADAGPDAGPQLDLRAFHIVSGELSTDLFVTDVIDGAIGAPIALSGPGGSSPVLSVPLSGSEDGSTVVFATGDVTNFGLITRELFWVQLGAEGPSAPLRISDDGETTPLSEVLLAADGSLVIYKRIFGSSEGQYYFVDLSGPAPGTPTPLTGGGRVSHGALSSDATTFAFHEGQAAFIVDLSGSAPSAPIKISPTPPVGGGVFSLVLAADGTKAAFAGDLEVDNVFELYVVDLSGPTPGPAEKASGSLVDGGDVNTTCATCTPRYQLSSDGSVLAYEADAVVDGVNELFVVDVSGAIPGSALRVNDPLSVGRAVLEDSPRLSPDGDWIAYLADQRTDEVVELFVADLSDGAPKPAQRISGALTDGGDVSRFLFAPNGSAIAYQADQNVDNISELFYVDLSGAVPSVAHRVNGEFGDGNRLASLAFADPYAFSPDGTHLAYIADETVDGRFELYVAGIADGTPAPAVSVQVPSNPQSFITRVDFSPDGNWLAFVGNTESPNRELWLVDLRGGAPGPARALSSNVTTPAGVSSVILRPGL